MNEDINTVDINDSEGDKPFKPETAYEDTFLGGIDDLFFGVNEDKKEAYNKEEKKLSDIKKLEDQKKLLQTSDTEGRFDINTKINELETGHSYGDKELEVKKKFDTLKMNEDTSLADKNSITLLTTRLDDVIESYKTIVDPSDEVSNVFKSLSTEIQAAITDINNGVEPKEVKGYSERKQLIDRAKYWSKFSNEDLSPLDTVTTVVDVLGSQTVGRALGGVSDAFDFIGLKGKGIVESAQAKGKLEEEKQGLTWMSSDIFKLAGIQKDIVKETIFRDPAAAAVFLGSFFIGGVIGKTAKGVSKATIMAREIVKDLGIITPTMNTAMGVETNVYDVLGAGAGAIAPQIVGLIKKGDFNKSSLDKLKKEYKDYGLSDEEFDAIVKPFDKKFGGDETLMSGAEKAARETELIKASVQIERNKIKKIKSNLELYKGLDSYDVKKGAIDDIIELSGHNIKEKVNGDKIKDYVAFLKNFKEADVSHKTVQDTLDELIDITIKKAESGVKELDDRLVKPDSSFIKNMIDATNKSTDDSYLKATVMMRDALSKENVNRISKAQGAEVGLKNKGIMSDGVDVRKTVKEGLTDTTAQKEALEQAKKVTKIGDEAGFTAGQILKGLNKTQLDNISKFAKVFGQDEKKAGISIISNYLQFHKGTDKVNPIKFGIRKEIDKGFKTEQAIEELSKEVNHILDKGEKISEGLRKRLDSFNIGGNGNTLRTNLESELNAQKASNAIKKETYERIYASSRDEFVDFGGMQTASFKEIEDNVRNILSKDVFDGLKDGTTSEKAIGEIRDKLRNDIKGYIQSNKAAMDSINKEYVADVKATMEKFMGSSYNMTGASKGVKSFLYNFTTTLSIISNHPILGQATGKIYKFSQHKMDMYTNHEVLKGLKTLIDTNGEWEDVARHFRKFDEFNIDLPSIYKEITTNDKYIDKGINTPEGLLNIMLSHSTQKILTDTTGLSRDAIAQLLEKQLGTGLGKNVLEDFLGESMTAGKFANTIKKLKGWLGMSMTSKFSPKSIPMAIEEGITSSFVGSSVNSVSRADGLTHAQQQKELNRLYNFLRSKGVTKSAAKSTSSELHEVSGQASLLGISTITNKFGATAEKLMLKINKTAGNAVKKAITQNPSELVSNFSSDYIATNIFTMAMKKRGITVDDVIHGYDDANGIIKGLFESVQREVYDSTASLLATGTESTLTRNRLNKIRWGPLYTNWFAKTAGAQLNNLHNIFTQPFIKAKGMNGRIDKAIFTKELLNELSNPETMSMILSYIKLQATGDKLAQINENFSSEAIVDNYFKPIVGISGIIGQDNVRNIMSIASGDKEASSLAIMQAIFQTVHKSIQPVIFNNFGSAATAFINQAEINARTGKKDEILSLFSASLKQFFSVYFLNTNTCNRVSQFGIIQEGLVGDSFSCAVSTIIKNRNIIAGVKEASESQVKLYQDKIEDRNTGNTFVEKLNFWWKALTNNKTYGKANAGQLQRFLSDFSETDGYKKLEEGKLDIFDDVYNGTVTEVDVKRAIFDFVSTTTFTDAGLVGDEVGLLAKVNGLESYMDEFYIKKLTEEISNANLSSSEIKARTKTRTIEFLKGVEGKIGSDYIGLQIIMKQALDKMKAIKKSEGLVVKGSKGNTAYEDITSSMLNEYLKRLVVQDKSLVPSIGAYYLSLKASNKPAGGVDSTFGNKLDDYARADLIQRSYYNSKGVTPLIDTTSYTLLGNAMNKSKEYVGEFLNRNLSIILDNNSYGERQQTDVGIKMSLHLVDDFSELMKSEAGKKYIDNNQEELATVTEWMYDKGGKYDAAIDNYINELGGKSRFRPLKFKVEEMVKNAGKVREKLNNQGVKTSDFYNPVRRANNALRINPKTRHLAPTATITTPKLERITGKTQNTANIKVAGSPTANKSKVNKVKAPKRTAKKYTEQFNIL